MHKPRKTSFSGDPRQSVSKRRATFSNVLPVEPHGTRPPVPEEAIEEMDSTFNGAYRRSLAGGGPGGGPAGTPGAGVDRTGSVTADAVGSPSTPSNRSKYVQIAGDLVKELDDDNDLPTLSHGGVRGGVRSGGRDGRSHDSADSESSIDTADLHDHRNDAHSSRASISSPFESRRHKHKQKAKRDRDREGSNFNGVTRGWSFDQESHQNMPLLREGTKTDYSAFTDPINGSDSFAIAMDDPNTQTSGILSPNTEGMQRFVDIGSDADTDEYDVPKSNPSSRRASDASSLNDVCFPMDSPRELDSTLGDAKVWPDLEVLREFAEEELGQNQLPLHQQTMIDDITGERTYSLSSTTGANGGTTTPLPQDQLENRLRPHRIIPWSLRNRYKPKGDPVPSSPFGGFGGGGPGDEKDSADYRFTYFREDMDATVHSPNISGLLQPGQTFADLFPPRISAPDTYSNEMPIPDDPGFGTGVPPPPRGQTPVGGVKSEPLRQLAAANRATQTQSSQSAQSAHNGSGGTGGSQGPGSGVTSPTASPRKHETSRRATNGVAHSSPRASSPRAVEHAPFWLNVMDPTEEEMKVISKTFGIHPLTTEDIFLGETREKVELFRNYYLVCFRSIDLNYEKERSKTRDRERRREKLQKIGRRGSTFKASSTGLSWFKRNKHTDEDHPLLAGTKQQSTDKKRSSAKVRSSELKPLNMYIIVFHEGVLTFHFSPTLHPLNVRRRARLLRDYITVSSDWVSYALIDDITDGFAPMIEAIEDEVNNIEEEIMKMHSGNNQSDESSDEEDEESVRSANSSNTSSSASGTQVWKERGDMLRRIGETRKRVMSLLRLLGNKADVIKGFSKRCNEQWQVAPRSEIGLYLGDIQDHIVTMVQSLNHYEKLLARSHSNYLAQINIDMTRVNNDMNDVLSKITVLGTIVLPMNIVTGLWGMNVLVPGQEQDSLTWFWSIVFGLTVFGILCWVLVRKLWKM